ncbi:MAG: M20/M25/M40 family metallo-hydrolase [Candidatus Aenigmarchaeota archaeon]|nr:M20/M25/M40 family metallo-hydrolase [Candidatus Aenigmarchaeota archaeon]
MDKLLKSLIETDGISGYEHEVRNLIQREISKYVDRTFIDKMGNLIAVKKGTKSGHKIMVAAHMDEIGLVAKSISSEGRIKFTTIGGIEPLTLIGQRVKLLAKKPINGIVTTSEMLDGNYIETLPKIEDMFVDTGLNKKELASGGIEVGTFIALVQEMGMLSNDMFYGKALDDRTGCYIIIQMAKLMEHTRNDINFVFTVQEEMGMYGAKTSTYEVDPDWAVAVDVSNTYESKEMRLLGKGPTILVKDAAMIANKCLDDTLRGIAKKNRIPIQLSVSDLGTTDAMTISLSRGGVPATVVGVPIKNLHSTVGAASMKDINNAIKLLMALLKNPPKVCLV